MYDLVPDSTFSFKRGGEKSSEKCASRPLCATTDSTGHASRCIVRSGVQRGGHPGPYGPIATISDPGPFPGVGTQLILMDSKTLQWLLLILYEYFLYEMQDLHRVILDLEHIPLSNYWLFVNDVHLTIVE